MVNQNQFLTDRGVHFYTSSEEKEANGVSKFEMFLAGMRLDISLQE